MSADFWVASGHHLTDRSSGGGLVVTDAFIKAFLARPELVPPDEACPVERGLHAALLDAPRLNITPDEIAAITDADARDNFAVFLDFRNRLLAQPTLEAAYLALYAGDVRGIPPLFLQQLTHVIARNAFDAVDDAFVLRAAECLYRAQRVSLHEGQVLLADHEAIHDHEHNRHHSPLLAMLGGPAVTELTVLNEDNAAGYKARSDAHDMVLNIAATRGRAALGESARLWIRHLTGLDIAFEPVERLSDAPVGWFLAFDAEAAQIANKVWRGEAVSAEAAARVLALYRFHLPDDPSLKAEHRGKAGFAVAAVSGDQLLTVKAQNLIVGLPLEQRKD